MMMNWNRKQKKRLSPATNFGKSLLNNNANVVIQFIIHLESFNVNHLSNNGMLIEG